MKLGYALNFDRFVSILLVDSPQPRKVGTHWSMGRVQIWKWKVYTSPVCVKLTETHKSWT